MHDKFSDVLQTQIVEIPIYSIQKPNNKKTKFPKNKAGGINRSKSQNRQGHSSIARTHLQFVRELAENEEEAEFLFDDDAKHSFDLQSELNKKSIKGNNNNTSALSQNQNLMPYLNGILDIDQVIANQIFSAKMAEQALKDLQGEAEVKLSDIQLVIDDTQAIQEQVQAISKERDDLALKVTSI